MRSEARGTGQSWLVAGSVLGLLGMVACALPDFSFGAEGDRVLPVRLPKPEYEALFPYYAELCAVSRFERIGVERGGAAGHAVMYLKGVCRDEDAPYPTVELCPERVDDLDDPGHGTGISVNSAFANVNWVAYPGRSLFFSGNLKRGQTLDAAHFKATIETIVEQELLRGVATRDENLRGVLPDLSPEEQLAESLLGTDVAIRFGRSIWCASLPLEKPQVESVIAELNSLNARRSFQYSLFFDNCVDTLHNTLAAAGIWEPKEPPKGILRGLVSMGVPANEVIHLARRANLFPLEDFDAVRGNETLLDSLTTQGWLPTQPGALLKSVPVHRPNELYDTSLQMYVVEGPGRSATRTVREMIDDGRYTDLDSNLIYYEARYQRILDDLGPGWWPRSAAYEEDLERYRTYITDQLAHVRELLVRFYAHGS